MLIKDLLKEDPFAPHSRVYLSSLLKMTPAQLDSLILRYRDGMANPTFPIWRGDLVLVDFGEGQGSEQSGIRPAVVIQNNKGNKHSPTFIVAAITRIEGKAKFGQPTHWYLPHQLAEPSFVMFEQIHTLDRNRFLHKFGSLNNRDIKQLNWYVTISLGTVSREQLWEMIHTSIARNKNIKDNLAASSKQKENII